ncbi:MAG: AarF/ABC1/UbiB kinase family protein [Candidatus Protochlamydia sp.]|nr:AarF/ABC1/UbiB kinase family protein [Candidatus Protochlamydia sp.]
MSLIKNLKHYNDLFKLFYKYWPSELLNEFSSEINLPKNEQSSKVTGKADELARDLEKLGPFYIKLGQILSTQSQFLPPEYEEALQKLQDKTEPMPYEEVEAIIKNELGDSPNVFFKNFEKKSLSAASLGQIHLAELANGKKVAVKIQRSGAQEEILELLEALGKLGQFLENRTEWGKKYHITEKFRHLQTTLLNELDYLKEADNLKTLHKNLKEFKRIVVPLPVDPLTTRRILTMDYVKGERITDLTALEKNDIDTKELADILFKAYIKQIFIDGFFQMDPHPGNIYLTSVNNAPAIAIFDLGMVERMPSQMQNQMIKCLFALSKGKELEVVKNIITLGKPLLNFDDYSFRAKINDIIATYRTASLAQTSIGRIVMQLARVAAESGLWLPNQFSAIGKTFLSIDPVLLAMDPNFKPNDVVQANMEDLFKEQVMRQFSFDYLYDTMLDGLTLLQQFPGRLTELLNLASQNNLKFKFDLIGSDLITRNFEKIANRITTGLILGSLIISAGLLMRVETPFQLFGYPGFAMIMFLLAATGALLLIGSIWWNDKKNN